MQHRCSAHGRLRLLLFSCDEQVPQRKQFLARISFFLQLGEQIVVEHAARLQIQFIDENSDPGE